MFKSSDENFVCSPPSTECTNNLTCMQTKYIPTITKIQNVFKKHTDKYPNIQDVIDNSVTCEINFYNNDLPRNTAQENFFKCMGEVPCDSECNQEIGYIINTNTDIKDAVNNSELIRDQCSKLLL